MNISPYMKKYFADIIRSLRWEEYTGLFQWPQSNEIVEEGKKIAYNSSKFLAGNTESKRQINKKKTTRSLLAYIHDVYMGDTWGKINNTQRWLKYHFS